MTAICSDLIIAGDRGAARERSLSRWSLRAFDRRRGHTDPALADSARRESSLRSYPLAHAASSA